MELFEETGDVLKTSCRTRRLGLPSLSIAALGLALLAGPAEALIVSRWDGVGTPALINTTPPPDDPGWANLSNRTGIYIGDGLYLTAGHTGPLTSIQLGGGTFPVIPGSGVALTNPSTFGVRRQNNGTLSANSDVILYRIGVDAATGLSPEETSPAVRRISIASRQPNTSTENLTIFGLGANRILNTDNTINGQFSFNSSLAVVPYSPTSTYRGFLNGSVPAPGAEQWQWGTNQRTTANPGLISSGSNVLIELGAVGQNSTVGNVYRFDEFGLPDEATGAGNDSGGAVFWKDLKGTPTAADDEWVLAGLNHGVYAKDGNVLRLGTFGESWTGYSDLSFSNYRTQIENSRGRFSLMGDINLDGVVTGSIVNGVATGDLAVLAANWLVDSGDADIQSWRAGDLNQDGVTDLFDFVQLRSALGGSISTQSFALLVGAVGIPEPSGVLLLVLAAGLATSRRRG